MVNQIKHTLQYLYRYSVKPISQFWLSFFLILSFSLLISISDETSFHLTGIISFPSLVFMFFFSFFAFKNIFPFVIKLGISRKAYILATYIYALLLSFLMTVLNYVYLYLFNFIADGFSIEGFDYTGLNMEGYVEHTFGNVYLFDWLLHLSIFLLITFIAAFYYRFGAILGTLLLALFPLSLLIRSIGFKFVELLNYFAITDEKYTTISYLIIIVICLVLNWFVVQRASTLDQITKQN